MSTETDLLRAIRDNPDEDTPRLMYADFLDEEEGYSARAEFIRVQVERGRLPQHDPRRDELEAREHELLDGHEDHWLGVERDNRDGLIEWFFERGFVDEVAATPVFMRGPGAGLGAAHPLRRWRVQSGQDNQVQDLRDAGQRGWFSRLEAVDLSDWYTTIGELSGFFARSKFERLRELNLTQRPGLDVLPEVLNYPFRDRLKVLRCGGSMYGEGGRLDVRDLAEALGPHCRLRELSVPGTLLLADDMRDLLATSLCDELTALDLHDNQIDANGWEAFRSARFRLDELDLSNTPLGATALTDLLGCASLGNLRRLLLNGCGNAAANMRALAESQFWTQAEELRIQNGAILNDDTVEEVLPQPEPRETALAPLFAATGSSNLRVLDVAGNRLGDHGVAQLCNAAWAGSLTHLDLSQNYLSDEALRTLAQSGRFKNLRILQLNFNSPYHMEGAEAHEAITDAGLRVLAECPDLANLRVLSVSGTRITAAGVDAVLNSRHWRLRELQLAQCQLRTDVIGVLADSPRLALLEALDLSGNDEISGGSLRAFAESEYLSPHSELDITGIAGGEKYRVALRERLGNRLSE